MAFWVYILASQRNGALYTGHTDNLPHRIWQHREGETPGFASRYCVKMLIWMEAQPTREAAKARERQIKKWKRLWKLRLIEEFNPTWKISIPISTSGTPFENR
jgi:putative endonuclease